MLNSSINGSSDTEPAGFVRRWETIATALRDDIAAGRFAPGERLPNESLLAERFAVNRHTLRQAMQSLAGEGFVQVRQGRGTFVRELVLDYALQRRTRLTQNLRRAGEQGRRELMAHAVEPGGEQGVALGVGPRLPVQWLHTRVTVRGRAVSLCSAAFPLPRLDGLVAAFEATGGISAALQRLGVDDYTRARSEVSCRLPTEAEADALARSVRQPLLVVRYLNVDPAGIAVEAGTTLFAGDAVHLTVEPEPAP